MVEVKAAEYGVLFFRRGRLIWDDYLHQMQYALTPQAQQVLRHFADWQELSTVGAFGDDAVDVAQRLIDTAVLLRRGSAEHEAERAMLAEWGDFGPATRHHHFAARTDGSARYVDIAEDEQYFRAKARRDPPPAPAKTYPDRPLIAFSDVPMDDKPWPRPRLLDALTTRRSTRKFAAQPVSLDTLDTLLRLTAGPVAVLNDPDLGPILFKTSPSAGARTPLELYIYANRVEGLPVGLYHYAPTRTGLENLGRVAAAGELEAIFAGQPALATAPVLVMHTAVIARTRWRYQSRRAYKDILIEAGHVSQTLLLATTAAGLGAVFMTAVCEEPLEGLLGCDSLAEIPIGVTALGHPATLGHCATLDAGDVPFQPDPHQADPLGQ